MAVSSTTTFDGQSIYVELTKIETAYNRTIRNIFQQALQKPFKLFYLEPVQQLEQTLQYQRNKVIQLVHSVNNSRDCELAHLKFYKHLGLYAKNNTIISDRNRASNYMAAWAVEAIKDQCLWLDVAHREFLNLMANVKQQYVKNEAVLMRPELTHQLMMISYDMFRLKRKYNRFLTMVQGPVVECVDQLFVKHYRSVLFSVYKPALDCYQKFNIPEACCWPITLRCCYNSLSLVFEEDFQLSYDKF